MIAENIKHLRLKAGMTQAEVAALLGVTSRTIATWESGSDKTLSSLETQLITKLFMPILLTDKIIKMTSRAFEAVPCEMVSFWLVHNEDCFTLPHTTRRAFEQDSDTPNIICSLSAESLTTYPLRTGETINLAGDDITNHKAKKNKHNRASYLLKDGICESLLHVPAFVPSSRGPQPILSLNFENKMASHDSDVIVALPGVGKIFDDNDVATAEALAEEYKNDILDDMKLLGVLSQ